jgi:hypothetical protein
MTKERVAFGLAVLELFSALPLYGIYTSPIRFYGADNFWSLISLAGNGLSVLFLLFPVLAVIGFMRRWRTRFLWLGLYPVVAFLFGVVPIPFATHLYTADKMLNTYFIAAIDILWVGIVAWLYWSIKRSNNTLQPTGYAGG